MKPFSCLVLSVVLIMNYSAPPAESAAQSDLRQPPITHYTSNTIQNSPDQQFYTYLPLSFGNFRPTCQGIPEGILTLFGPSLVAYYPLWETAGDTVVDLSPNNHFGMYKGDPALNSVTALCGNTPGFDGLNDSADVFSTRLASAFNGDEGTAIIQLKIRLGEWVDGKESIYLALRANSTNNIVFYKSANNQLHFAYTSNGIKQAATYDDLATDKWVTYAITWSKSNDRFLGYMAGESICPEPVEP